MGCGASFPSGEEDRLKSQAEAQDKGARPLTLENPNLDLEAVFSKAEAGVDKYYHENRVNMSKFINGPEPSDPDERLLRGTACATVFSAIPDHFRCWAQHRAHVNDLSICLSPSSMNFGCTALSFLAETSSAIQTAADPDSHNQPIPDTQVANVFQMRAIWEKMLDASSAYSYKHPQLGRLCVIQPVFHTCVMWRMCGGNGENGNPDPVFEYLLDCGADPNIRSSLGIPALHLAIATFFSKTDQNSDPSEENIESGLKLLTMLIDHGADPKITITPFNDQKFQLYCCAQLNTLEKLFKGNVLFNAFDILKHFLGQTDRPELRKVEDILNKSSTKPLEELLSVEVPPIASWNQSIYNVIWSISQISRAFDKETRRSGFLSMHAGAPFNLPMMTAMPFSELRELGYMPRYDTICPDPKYPGPVLLPDIPTSVDVVFLSHRWLRPGQPDDEHGTKFKQICSLISRLSDSCRKPVEEYYIWSDYSCVDQSSPLPGVQALPQYIACCDVFAWVWQEEYMERAWCLTEQFMHHQLRCQPTKFCLRGETIEEEGPTPCPDPALGKLYSEPDRVALTTMTAIFSHAGHVQ